MIKTTKYLLNDLYPLKCLSLYYLISALIDI